VVELGYWRSEDMQGLDIMTMSCRAVLDWLFEKTGIKLVEIWVAVPNLKSRAIPERLGFQLEGYLRDRMLANGDNCDAAVYSILARDWTQGRDQD
jgi:ribosomal-protein-serine acetyltransferase